MLGKYAYSLNGETYRGAFATRSEALSEAMAMARQMSEIPQTVYVGRIVLGDPKASGHARAILAHMAARAREEFGDAASSYLTQINPEQLDELDEVLELVIRGWLHRNGLLPAFFKTDAIGEYPVLIDTPTPKPSEETEVQEIGSGEYSAS